ncbi:hypothetical protein IL992_23780 [Microbispora sp. NEAU-D428]|uniref:hypothetical protein n=1 Tax=Microbispora sitophila TaxID=2771537 RepID=UPI00186642AD|nr:hypothetical protein [Microbispora sitophila]MBE3012194.1 hypothetical protein [Microbispora sitophila]
MSETEHGYSPDVGGGSEEAKRAGDLAFRPEAAGEPGPGRKPSAEEESGVPVGESLSRGGEELAKQKQEPGRGQVGVQGKTDRPHGRSTLDDSTGIAPEGPIDEESPPLPAGDQGG